MRFYFDIYRHNDLTFFTNQLQFAVESHTVANIRAPYRRLHGTPEQDFYVNNIRLSYAIARTLCSHNPDREEYYLDTIASFLGLLNTVEHPNNNGKFLLIPDRIRRLRDFSLTGRIGEMAQGVNYLFTQERLGFPFIVDYHFFCQQVGLNTRGASPDFVVFDPRSGMLGLLESKGEGPGSSGIKGKMRKALAQLTSARTRLGRATPPINASQIMPCCTKFFTTTNKTSTIHYCLRTSNGGWNTISTATLFKIHYASWFYLVGDFTRARQLIAGEAMNVIETGPGSSYTFENDVYWVEDIEVRGRENDNRFFHAGRHMPRPFNNVRIGIHQTAVEKLIRETAELDSLALEYSETEGENYYWFKDATVINL